ncbi:MAG: glycogen synthase GlgA [Planctomycetota bacterium]
MKILFAAAEVHPLAKTGGLADVAGALPKALRALTHEVEVVMPFYRIVREKAAAVASGGIRVVIPMGGRSVTGDFHKTVLPGSDVPVWLLKCDEFYDRPALYGEGGGEYPDAAARYIFFSRAVVELARRRRPDILHANDWQTGLVPALLATIFRGDPDLRAVGTVFTAHNLAYQGNFPPKVMGLTGIDAAHFNWREMEFWGRINLLKAGLVYADVITTVSPTYAHEIRSAELGYGLEGVLVERHADLAGVVNGIGEEWNPATDPFIPVKYNATDIGGKAVCKGRLQKIRRLPPRNVPLIGMITRLVDQKGLDIVVDVMDWILAKDVQLVILGTGDPDYEALFRRLADERPHQVSAIIAFDSRTAHEIEAGADIFLMPSRYEPCGLNQLYSLKYGTIPVVRKTGGLADTVKPVTSQGLRDGTSTGFLFEPYAADALRAALEQALAMFPRRLEWQKLMRNGMAQDWSWARSAREYAAIYANVKTLRRVRGPWQSRH